MNIHNQWNGGIYVCLSPQLILFHIHFNTTNFFIHIKIIDIPRLYLPIQLLKAYLSYAIIHLRSLFCTKNSLPFTLMKLFQGRKIRLSSSIFLSSSIRFVLISTGHRRFQGIAYSQRKGLEKQSSIANREGGMG
jgi:hypothetical protein